MDQEKQIKKAAEKARKILARQNQPQLALLLGADYIDLQTARDACAKAKELGGNPLLIVCSGGSPGTFRIVANGDIEASL